MQRRCSQQRFTLSFAPPSRRRTARAVLAGHWDTRLALSKLVLFAPLIAQHLSRRSVTSTTSSRIRDELLSLWLPCSQRRPLFSDAPISPRTTTLVTGMGEAGRPPRLPQGTQVLRCPLRRMRPLSTSGPGACNLPHTRCVRWFDTRIWPYALQVTGKRVSVWSTDKRSSEMERMGPASREHTLEVLKTEVIE